MVMFKARQHAVASIVVAALVAASAPGARAQTPDPSGGNAPATVTEEQPFPWQRHAFYVALIGTGLGLGLGVTEKVISNRRADEFNQHANRGCRTGVAGNGAPGCTELLDRAESANRWSQVGFAAAGIFAVTALVLKLTEGPESTAVSRVACAPGVGLSAACQLSF
jgi:hypothetical protein